MFTAPRDFTPGGTDQVNSLDDDDVLTGTGNNPTLDFTFVDDADIAAGTPITPTLVNINTINVNVQGAANKTLDLQDATGVNNVNISRINASNLIQVTNINDGLTNTFSVNNSVNPTAVVNFTHTGNALTGAADTTALRLNSALLSRLNLDNSVFSNGGALLTAPTQGYETINLSSVGNGNAVDVLGIYGNEALVVTGAANLTLGAAGTAVGSVSGNVEAQNFAAGLAGVTGFITRVDASAMTGALQYNIGGEIDGASSKNSGAPIQLTVTGGSAADTFVLTTGAVVGGVTGNTDVIIGGAGNDRVLVTGTAAINAAATPNVRAVEGLEIRTGHDVEAANVANATPEVVSVDADAFDALATILVRNEGQKNITQGLVTAIRSVAEAATVSLVDLTAAQATAITVEHGTTGNNVINAGAAAAAGETEINVDLKTPGANDTVAVRLQTGLNTDQRFNFTLNAVSTNEPGTPTAQTTNVENITINDADNESNSILLQQATTNAFTTTNPVGHTGTVKIEGGQAGQFLNLDATANAYRYDLSGGTADLGTIIPGTNGNRSGNDGAAAERLNSAVIDSSTYLGNIIVRVSDNSANNQGGQNILFGTGNDTVIFDQVVGTAANVRTAGLTISDTVNGGTGNDILALDGNAVPITIGASEWTNVSNFEIIRLIGNGVNQNNARDAVNSYNLTITNQLLGQNGVSSGANKLINIVNDNDGNNDIVFAANGLTYAGRNDFINVTPNAVLTGVEHGVTIDARSLNAGFGINYNGEEGRGNEITADRFIFADANINGVSVIDGGRLMTAGVAFDAANPNAGAVNGRVVDRTTNGANQDVLEVRNSAVVSLGDLENIRNVGTIEFTNDQATAQNSILTLDGAAIDRLVNDGQVAGATVTGGTNGSETITVATFSNGAIAATGLRLDGALATASTNIVFNGANGGNAIDTITTGAGADTITGGAGADNLTGGAGVDQFRFGTTDGTDTIAFVATEDRLGFLDGNGGAPAVNFATVGTTAGVTLVAADFDAVAAIANVASATGGAGNGNNQVYVITATQTTAQITAAVTDAATGADNAYVVVFNSTTNAAEVYFDAEWGDAAGRVQVATLTGVTSAQVAALTANDFVAFI